MDPYKILGISSNATEQEIKRAYRAQAAKYHPDHGGDAWVFEQIRAAYEQLTEAGATAATNDPASKGGTKSAAAPFSQPEPISPEARTKGAKSEQHWYNRPLPLQSETSWFILVNVLDIVLTNVLLQRGAMEANPIANFVFIQFGFAGMIAFKLASVVFVCLAAQLIARKSPSKARGLLWFGCILVGAVLVYSSRLILYSN
ncbi:DUF5658 family protein [Pirellulaceae bacterium SH449]